MPVYGPAWCNIKIGLAKIAKCKFDNSAPLQKVDAPFLFLADYSHGPSPSLLEIKTQF